MPDTEHKIKLERQAIKRLVKALGVKDADLDVTGSDTTMTRIHTYERIAEIIEEQNERRDKEATAALNAPPVTVETVVEKPMQTTETVEVREAKG